MWLEDGHLLCGFDDGVEGLVELGAGVLAGHDGADAGFAFWDGGEGDAGGHDAGVEERAGEVHGEAAVADDDGRDGGFAGGGGFASGVKAGGGELLLEVAGVVPEALDAFGFVLENVKGGDAGGGDRGRMGGGEEEGAGAMVEVVDEVFGSADVAAERADGLGEGSDLNVDAAVAVEVIDGAAAVASEDAGGVGVVDHHDGSVFFGQVGELVDGADVAVHGEDAVGDDEFVAGLVGDFLQELFGVGDVLVAEDFDFCSGEARAVDDGGMVELVGDDEVFLAEDGGDGSGVGGEAALEDDAGFDIFEAGDFFFQFDVDFHGSGDGADGAGADTVVADGLDGGFSESGVVAEAEVVVGGEVDDLFAVVGADGGLDVIEDAEAEVGAFLAELVELIGEVLQLGARGRGVSHNGISYRKRLGRGIHRAAGEAGRASTMAVRGAAESRVRNRGFGRPVYNKSGNPTRSEEAEILGMMRQFLKRAEGRKLGVKYESALLMVLMLLCFTAARAQQATRTELGSSAHNGKLTLSARVADVESSPLDTGSVSFETVKGSLGSAFVKNGAASLTVSGLPTGVKQVTAVYHPATSDFSASVSSPLAAVSPAATSTVPSFNVTASPSSATVTAGGFTTVVLTVNSVNGFNGTVNLSCSNLPTQATCTFTPVSVQLTSKDSSITSSLQIATVAASGVSKNVAPGNGSPAGSPFGRGGTRYLAFLLPGGVALLGVFALRRKHGNALKMLGLVALLAVCSTGLTACGARYSYLLHKPFPNYGTPSGLYSVVVSAYSSNGTSVQQATSSSSGCSGAVCVALTVK